MAIFQHEVGRKILSDGESDPDQCWGYDRISTKYGKTVLRRNSLFSIYVQLVKLIFGGEPLHTLRKYRLVGNLPYRSIWEDIEVETQRYEN